MGVIMMKMPCEMAIDTSSDFVLEEMKYHLAKIERMIVDQAAFVIRLSHEETKSEQYSIAISDAGVVIHGQSLRAMVYGMYDFLEKDVGFQFLAVDCTMVPDKDKIELRCTERTESPAFEYRDVYWRGALDARFALRCRLNAARANIPSQWGGRVRFYNYSHTIDDLVSPDIYFDEHPEYFAMVGTKRLKEKTQLCLTNEEVLQICISQVLRWMRENPDCQIFSVAQNDWYHYCTCEKCKALDEHEGSHAGSLIHFVNRIAQAVQEEFPNNYLHTFAYLYTRKPPRYVRPLPNVIIRLCSIECCFSHPMEECSYAVDDIEIEDTSARTFAPSDALFRGDLEAWSALTNKLYIWDYTTNFANYLMPFPNLHVLQPNLKLFRKYGAKGVFEQGNYAMGDCSAFGTLKIYLLGKLLWNPDENVETLTQRFVAGYYGKAAQPSINAYLNLVEKAAQSGHMCLFDGAQASYLSDEVLLEGDDLLTRALSVTVDTTQRERIERERLSPRYLQLVRMPLDTKERKTKIEAFRQDAVRLNIGELFERRALNESFKCMEKSLYTEDRKGVPYSVYRL